MKKSNTSVDVALNEKKSAGTHSTRAKTNRLPDAELDVMLVLWNSDKPLKASAIMELLEGKRDWSMSTLHVLLARMSERGVIDSVTEKNYRLYSPVISKEEYRETETKSFLRKLYDNSAKRLIVSLIETDGITDAELDEIGQIIDTKRKN